MSRAILVRDKLDVTIGAEVVRGGEPVGALHLPASVVFVELVPIPNPDQARGRRVVHLPCSESRPHAHSPPLGGPLTVVRLRLRSRCNRMSPGRYRTSAPSLT